MSVGFIHLNVESVKAIHREVLAAHGGLDGIREPALLESALAAPQASLAGQTLITDPIEAAGAYLFYLCRNHPFNDGNKRTALAACLVFLNENGWLLDEELDVDAWENLVMKVASSQWDRDQTTKGLRSLLERE